jgi:hypothetical protein
MPPSTAAAPDASSRIVAPLEPTIGYVQQVADVGSRDEHGNRRSRAMSRSSRRFSKSAVRAGSEANPTQSFPKGVGTSGLWLDFAFPKDRPTAIQS